MASCTDSFMVAMADGVRLATDVYLPEPIHHSRATVLVRLPYDKTGRYTFLPEIAARMTAHGFAVVVQDVRGKFLSEGERVPFVNEVADGAATLDWIVAQSWSNGVVGMMGDSYYGFTQWAAVASGHPALRAIVPRVTGSEFFRIFAPDLVPRLPLHEWVMHTFSVPEMLESPYATMRGGRAAYELPAEAARVGDLIRDLANGHARRSLVTPALPLGRPAANLSIPALHMGGWWDNLQRHQLSDWHAASRSPAGGHQFLRMGASDHEDFRLHEDDEPHANHEVDDDALAHYLDRMTADPIAFLDHYLHGRQGRWLAPRVRYEIANLGWQAADRWVPADVVERQLVLGRLEAATGTADGGSLSPTVRAERSSISWTHNPAEPVPFLIASEWSQCEHLPDEQALHERADAATFTTDGFGLATDIVGHVEAELHVSTSGPSGHIVARLLDVYPSGRARVVLEGAALVEGPQVATRCRIDLGDTAYRMRPGHRLRLAISASCFPLYPVHPGTSAEVWDAQAAIAPATYTLLGMPGAPSVLKITTRR